VPTGLHRLLIYHLYQACRGVRFAMHDSGLLVRREQQIDHALKGPGGDLDLKGPGGDLALQCHGVFYNTRGLVSAGSKL